MSVKVIQGDCCKTMARLIEEGVVVDSIVTDPPYGLEFMGKDWDRIDAWRDGGGMSKPGIGERETPWVSYGGETANPSCRLCGGRKRGAKRCACDTPDWHVKGETYDPAARTASRAEAMQEWHHRWAVEAFRILKPGGHMLVFGGTRTYHRMACAVEDAGFEIRDAIMWHYGSGFPKSHDVSKAIDRAADYELQALIRRAAVESVEAVGLVLPNNSRWDWTVGEHAPGNKWWTEFQQWLPALSDGDRDRVEGEIIARVQKAAGWFTRKDIYDVRAPATAAARKWQGWGTALKPATEIICLARKPLSEKTIAANVLEHGTGALNVDVCRVVTDDSLGGGMVSMGRPKASEGWDRPWMHDAEVTERKKGESADKVAHAESVGRWPANVILSYPEDEYLLRPGTTQAQKIELYRWMSENA